ncbi:cob(I)yrinic acid a,c-diamide adenosyltransferase [Peredibacter starrii]|uniref:Corrinoid adenosyltransferase n=1 Tax=Peredibacter starrii TaxID=28202 RepID=A0AAX4HQC6_9BACT|nr:cob(I)yrinic acid a,c-diamide adenosyltransferase [Peredibacter starrii]WPU65313.1 cob(I)yrinic acid a,c-diamide adenosyltransferase [Peredibacter starrii]
MKKAKVYTRTGDKGSTGLVSGNRISKADSRIDLYGELDELNSRVGVGVSYLALDVEFKNVVDFLHHIQSAIFDLGSNLACEVENRAKYNLPQISDEYITDIEHEIDRMDGDLDPLKSFILPGGTHAAAAFHVCRTGARSVERKLIHYYETTGEELPKNSAIFLNRLSDYFFILSRYINKHKGVAEIEWKPRN